MIMKIIIIIKIVIIIVIKNSCCDNLKNIVIFINIIIDNNITELTHK